MALRAALGCSHKLNTRLSGLTLVGNEGNGALVANHGWKRPFDEPIPLPRGRQLVTLQH